MTYAVFVQLSYQKPWLDAGFQALLKVFSLKGSITVEAKLEMSYYFIISFIRSAWMYPQTNKFKRP